MILGQKMFNEKARVMNIDTTDLKSLILYKYCILKNLPVRYSEPDFSEERELSGIRAAIQKNTEYLHKLHNTDEKDYFQFLTGLTHTCEQTTYTQEQLKEIEKQKESVKELEPLLKQFPNNTSLLGHDLYDVVMNELNTREGFHQRTLDRVEGSGLDPNDLDTLRKLFQEEIDKTNQDFKYLEDQLKQITAEIKEINDFKKKLNQFDF